MEQIQVNIMPGKAPFNYGMFKAACVGLIGRPTEDRFIPNYVDLFWEIKDDANSLKTFQGTQILIGEYLECFNIETKGYRCDIAKWRDTQKPDTLYLRVSFHFKI
jgi:hypothetical protein